MIRALLGAAFDVGLAAAVGAAVALSLAPAPRPPAPLADRLGPPARVLPAQACDYFPPELRDH